MPDGPIFNVPIPLRCCQDFGNSGRAFCGAPAVSMRPANGSTLPRYFCEKHARPSDLEIPAERHFRRVQIIIEVLVAGTTAAPGLAELDALSRTISAIESIGGICNLFQVTSQIGRTAGQAPRPGADRDPGKG